MTTDALIVVDVQYDFLPGGTLGVLGGDAIIPVLNRLIARFAADKLPVVASRDWHPRDHCSFRAQGGPWPPHCIQGTHGAEFAAELELPSDVKIISKATNRDREAYSAFEGTELEAWLRKRDVKRLIIGGLATDYCVKHTSEDALNAGFDVAIVEDAVCAVNLRPDDGKKALEAAQARGAEIAGSEDLA